MFTMLHNGIDAAKLGITEIAFEGDWCVIDTMKLRVCRRMIYEGCGTDSVEFETSCEPDDLLLKLIRSLCFHDRQIGILQHTHPEKLQLMSRGSVSNPIVSSE